MTETELTMAKGRPRMRYKVGTHAHGLRLVRGWLDITAAVLRKTPGVASAGVLIHLVIRNIFMCRHNWVADSGLGLD